MSIKNRPRNTRNISRLVVLIGFIAGALAIHFDRDAAADGKSEVSFNRDIRPIFSDTCFRCHGPDKNSRKAGLRLDLRDEAIKKTKSGVIPIVPGKPEESEIVRRILTTEKFELMPPESAHKELTAQQKELIKRWVAEGAKYEGHWAYQPVNRPEIPADTAQHPIDAFIQARLAKEGLQPSPAADRRTLIRRISLDLTGIPPTPREVAAFVNDQASFAYERLVDRLLDSPRYAEKQAMHWLDAVRYADTSGFHGDNLWPAWPYRDYVLRAFRDNKPFDQFTREQIAGDLMPQATDEQKIASAYNRLNRVSAEGGLQPKEYLAKYGADRVRTTATVWLGATMGCAECHDHKFDPFLSKDFYAMKAFFADIKETGLVPDRGRDAWGSKLTLPTDEQKKAFDELTAQIKSLQTGLDEKAMTMNSQRVEWEQRMLEWHKSGKLAWNFQRPLSAKAKKGATLTIYNDEQLIVTQYKGGSIVTEQTTGDGLVIATGANPDNETYTVTFKPGAGEWTALGIEVVQDESLPGDRFSRGGDRFVLTEVEANVSPANVNPGFSLATTDKFGEPMENPAMAAIDGDPKTGWGVSFGDGRNAFIALRFARKVQTSGNSTMTVTLRHDSNFRKATIGRFRLALSSVEHSWPDHTTKTNKPILGLPADVLNALIVEEAKRGDLASKAVFNHFKWSSPELLPMAARIAELEAKRDLLDAQIPRVLVAESVKPSVTRILARGNFMDESGEIVSPEIPVVFGKLDLGGRRANRLDLADWITSKNNPLTARVFVNRLWRQFFGAGLSKSLDDTGSQGEWPTHPELLDWLAAEFMRPQVDCGSGIADCGLKRNQKTSLHDWDMKHIIRLIVTSQTYKQTSNPQSAIRNPQSIDSDNRLLSHQNRFRVDAEMVRDLALSVSGLLVEKFGGRSAKPYQPEGYLGALNFPKRDYTADRGESLYRRGLYTQWQRTFLHPSLIAFDAPSREECTVNRVSSNTPLQALVLLNDPIYVEAARAMAQNAVKQGGPALKRRINWAFERALGRRPNLNEQRILIDLHNKSLAKFQRNPASAGEMVSIGDAPKLAGASDVNVAAMMTVTRAILNLHEMITRN